MANNRELSQFASLVVVDGDSLSVTGNVSIAGTLTYEDVTNIDSVGLITARSGIEVTSGGINAVGVTTTSQLNVGAGGTVITTGSKGFVGINSTTPSLHQLEIVSGSDDPALMLYRRRNTSGGVVFQCFDDVDSTKRSILQLTTNGSLVLPQQISWFANKNNSTTVNSTSISAPNIIAYNDDVFDVGSSYSSVDSKFTAPVSGKYFYSFTLNVPAFGNTFIIGAVKNGSFYERSRIFDIGAHRKTYSTSGIIDLAENDYIEIGAYVTTGSTTTDNFGMFCGYLLG